MRKVLLGFALLLVVCVGVYVRFHRRGARLERAYAGNRQVTLLSTTAQVREPVATVNFGDRLEILQRTSGYVRVRTTKGVTGWVAERELLSADLWQEVKELEAKAASMPVEARGHTRVLSNLHIEPGRETPRIRQLSKNVPVELLAREAQEAPSSEASSEEEEKESGASQPKKEDWWLVRARPPEEDPIAGWALGRFIGLDVPAPLPDYASSAGMRITAWFELNRVKDATGAIHAQYLVAGTHGPEGQPCDFTMLRAFTWGEKRRRYETAFVEGKLCGKLPVKLEKSAPGGEVAFAFENSSKRGAETRVYRMHQTVIRRIRERAAPQK